MRLRTKFAAGLLLLTLLLSTTAYGGLEYYKHQQVERTEADVSQTAARAATQIDAEIVDRRDYVAYVAQKVGAADGERTDRLLGGMLDNSRFLAVHLVTANGTVAAVAGPYTPERRSELVGTETGGGACVARTLTYGDACAASSNPNASTGRSFLVVTAPIFDGGDVGGALVATLPMDGRTVFSTLRPLDTRSQAVSVVADGERVYDRHERFDRRVTASAPVESTGWTVTVERDRSGLDNQLETLALAQGVGIFLLMGLVVGFGAWEYTVNLRQAERLLGGFRAIERREYDRTLSLSTGDEWEQISDGFNGLAASLERREAELREREQRLEVLNRVLRHNVRNEMNIILSYAALVAEEGEERTAEMAETISAAGRRLLDVGENARRAEAALGEWNGSPGTVDLSALTADAVETVRADYPDATVRCSLPETCPVRGVPAVGNAVEALVENACEHHDGEPTIEIDLVESTAGGDETGTDVLLTVADDGPGIPEHELVALERGEETPLEHGSGLGLWLVYWLVDRCDGDFAFRSNDPRGTVVELRLGADDGLDRDGPSDDGPSGVGPEDGSDGGS